MSVEDERRFYSALEREERKLAQLTQAEDELIKHMMSCMAPVSMKCCGPDPDLLARHAKERHEEAYRRKLEKAIGEADARETARMRELWMRERGHPPTPKKAVDPCNKIDVKLEAVAIPALDRQVGGDHYKDLAMQPVEYCHHNKLGFCESSAVKYLTRWRAKNGLQDVEKAGHFVDLLIQLVGNIPGTSLGPKLAIDPMEYCNLNRIGYYESAAILILSEWWKGGTVALHRAQGMIDSLIKVERKIAFDAAARTPNKTPC